MILYNVTINVDDDSHDEWIDWMQHVHIPKVMATGLFRSYTMYKILSRHEEETGTTYSVQYLLAEMALFEQYRDNHAPALQKETIDKFGDRFSAFRTLLESV
jgi:hypothetical protein